MPKPDDVLAEVLPPPRDGAEVVPISDNTSIRQAKKKWTSFTDERKQVFLDELEQKGDKNLAAALAGVHVRTINDHLRSDPEFRRLYEESYSAFKGNLEAIALQRSQVSDRVLELVLKRHIPEYRERVQVDQRTQVLPPPDQIDVSSLGPEQRRALMVLLGVTPPPAAESSRHEGPDDGPEQPQGVPEASETPEDQPG
jgi:hypothetical protein